MSSRTSRASFRRHSARTSRCSSAAATALSEAAAARGLLRGGLDPEDVAAAVRRTGARVVHAHNVQPAFGWRALAAARAAGARTVLTLHQYRLVCAVGTCLDPSGQDCTRCHGRDTRPGRAAELPRQPRATRLVYAAALARWSGRLVADGGRADDPERLHARAAAGARRAARRARRARDRQPRRARSPPSCAHSPPSGTYAICSARLAPDKGVDVAIRACAAEGIPLVVTGHGPDEGELRALAASLGADVRFAGRVPDAELARLRAGAALAIVPSRFAETFGLSAAEAMAAGLPVAASRVGALTDLLPDADLAPMGDADALATRRAAPLGRHRDRRAQRRVHRDARRAGRRRPGARAGLRSARLNRDRSS